MLGAEIDTGKVAEDSIGDTRLLQWDDVRACGWDVLHSFQKLPGTVLMHGVCCWISDRKQAFEQRQFPDGCGQVLHLKMVATRGCTVLL